MIPFNKDATCPKCGCEEVASSFTGSHDFCYRCTGRGMDHIHRVCRRCHFRWNEAPLDNGGLG